MADLVVDDRHVVHETIDDETIIIHLGTGAYYSLDGSATAVWGPAAAGVPGDRIAAAICSAHPEDDPQRITAAVTALLDRLVEEGLLVESPGAATAADPVIEGVGPVFADPVLQKYTDMQEFMLVDPLHEVDEQAGWPNVKTG